MLTAYQAQAIVWELTRRKGDTLSQIAETLADIPVDLNPHLGRQKSTLEKERSEKMRLQLNRQEEIRQTRDMLLEQLEAQISGTKSSVSQLFLIEWSVKNSIMRNSMESVAVPK